MENYPQARTFADAHDYCDANDYWLNYLGCIPDDPDAEQYCQVANTIADIVDAILE